MKTTLAAVVFCAATGFGLTACDTGSSAGDTNREDSSIRDTDENIRQSAGSRDTTDYDHHYDHARHPDSVALGDGAYKQGGGERIKRP